MPADARMDGEVVHSLLTLLDQRVAIQFPGQVLYLSVYLFQSLVDRYGPHRNGTVADDPFPRFVYVLSGRKIHQCVSSPFTAPHCFLHLFVYARGSGGVADVGIDFHQEVAAYNHRFGFGMVDVGRQHRPSFGYFLTYEFGCDMGLDAQFFAVHILTDSHIFHFGSDNALFGIRHLGDMPAGLGPVGQCDMFKTEVVEAPVIPPHASVFRTDLGQLFHVSSVQYPFFTQAREAFFQIDFYVGVTERTAGIVDVHMRIGSDHLLFSFESCAGHLLYFSHTYTDFGE